MRRQTILILAIIAFFSSCNRTPDLTEEEIYVILNEIITDDSLRFSSTLCSFLDTPPLDHRTEKIFSQEDLKFIEKQLNIFSMLQLKPGKIKRTRWREIQKKNISPYAKIIPTCSDTILHSYFSLPLISADRSKVVLRVGHGGGFMIGGGETYLFEKRKNKWFLVDTWDIIIVYAKDKTTAGNNSLA